MKRFILFCGDTYYPLGGWNDLEGFYDTLEDAKKIVEDRIQAHKPLFPGRTKEEDWNHMRWAQVVDAQMAQIVWSA